MVFRVILFFLMLSGLSAEAGEFLFIDDGGHSVELKHEAKRVVSLYSGHSENLLFLGLGDKLVGVSQADEKDLFPGVPRLSRRIDPESIVALKPDLVIIRPMVEKFHGKAISMIRRMGITVCSLDPPSWEGVDEYVKKLCLMTGCDSQKELERVHAMVSSLRKETDGVKKKKVFFVESMEKGLRTCSPGSWSSELLSLAGGENGAYDASPIREGSAIASYGLERMLGLVARKLDFYIVQKGPMNDINYSEIKERPWFSALSDVKVIIIEEKDLSRPSLLRLQNSVDKMRGFMYPNDLKR